MNDPSVESNVPIVPWIFDETYHRWVCTKCSMHFSTNEEIQEHMATGEHPYCSPCKRFFASGRKANINGK